MPIFIDLPTQLIETDSFVVAGWVASDADPSMISLAVNGLAFPFTFFPRPDVRQMEAYAAFTHVSGVVTEIQLADVPGHIAIEIELRCGDECARAAVDAAVAAASLLSRRHSPSSEETRRAAAARAWCDRHLVCAKCRAPASALHRRGTEEHPSLQCAACGSDFPQAGQAINMISPELGLEANIAETDNVSANPYAPAARALIARTVSHGGWVLDCGAGLRVGRMRNVINMEIVDYPSTDVLAVGEALPFADGSFDAVVSLAVLEHVRDPFACASEILRVLKPGGEILAEVPFLQPVHGYPNHYYNMSQQGLANLFASGADVIDCSVPPHGHPIFAVRWLLDEYLKGLAPEARDQFSQITIGQAARLDPHLLLGRSPMTVMTAPAMNTVACLNALLARKR